MIKRYVEMRVRRVEEWIEGQHREVALGPKEPVLELVSGNIAVREVD